MAWENKYALLCKKAQNFYSIIWKKKERKREYAFVLSTINRYCFKIINEQCKNDQERRAQVKAFFLTTFN